MGGNAWLWPVLKGIWFILPAYVANVSACIFGGGRPLDFGKKLSDGRRVLGDGVTVRGCVTGILAGTLVGLGEGIADENPWKVWDGFLLGTGAILGDAIGSFVKRRIGLKRGAPAPGLDQLDFFAGAVILYYLVVGWSPSGWILGTLALLTLGLHWLANAIGYLLKLKEVPW